MSYAAGEALQAAVFAALSADGSLAGMVFDAVPRPAPDLFVALGDEDARMRRDAGGAVGRHDLRVSVVTRRSGFADAKRAAARVCAVLERAALLTTAGRVLDVRLLRARARMDEGEGARRVDLWFRARIDLTGEGD